MQSVSLHCLSRQNGGGSFFLQWNCRFQKICLVPITAKEKLEVCIGSAKPVIEMLKLFLKAIPHHEDIICKVILYNDLWGEEAELAFSMAGASKCPTFGSAPVAEPAWGAFSEHWPIYLVNKRLQVKVFFHLWLVPSLHPCARLWLLNVPHMPIYPVTSPRILELGKSISAAAAQSEVSDLPTCKISF